MATSTAPLAGLLRDLGALEGRQRDTSFESIRCLPDEAPSRGWRLLVDVYSRFVRSQALPMAGGAEDPEAVATFRKSLLPSGSTRDDGAKVSVPVEDPQEEAR